MEFGFDHFHFFVSICSVKFEICCVLVIDRDLYISYTIFHPMFYSQLAKFLLGMKEERKRLDGPRDNLVIGFI